MKFVPSPLPSPRASAAGAEPIPLPLSLPIQPRDTLPPPGLPTCYHPNGQPSLPDLPCSDTHDTHTFCCPASYTCSSNRVCFPPAAKPQQHLSTPNQLQLQLLPIRASCTDQTWTSDACPDFCISDHSGNSSLKLCAMKTHETVYCCSGGSNSSSEAEADCDCDAHAAGSDIVTVAMYQSLSRPQLNTNTNTHSATPKATPEIVSSLLPDNPLNSIPSSSNGTSGSTGTGTGISISIFSPNLPRPLTNLYTALIVLGCVWCISALCLLCVLVVVRVMSWRRDSDSDCASSTRSRSSGLGSGSGAPRGRGDTGSMFGSSTSERMAGLWFAPGPEQGPWVGMVWKGEGDGDPFADAGYGSGDVDRGSRRRASTGSSGVAVPMSSPTLGGTSLHAGSGNGGARRGIPGASSRSSAGSLSVGSLEVVVEEREGEGEEYREGNREEDEKKDAMQLEKGNGNVQMWAMGWREESTEGQGLEEADIGVAIRMEDNHRVGPIWQDDRRIRS